MDNPEKWKNNEVCDALIHASREEKVEPMTMERHLKFVAWMHILWLPVGFVIALTAAQPSSGIINGLALLFFLIIFSPDIYAAFGVLQFSSFCRRVMIIYSVLFIVAIPLATLTVGYSLWTLFQKDTLVAMSLGTLMGGYSLWVLFHKEGRILFQSKVGVPTSRLTIAFVLAPVVFIILSVIKSCGRTP